MSLLLTRNVGETVLIDKDIFVKVLSVKGKQVLLAIDAPKQVPVDRLEIHWEKETKLRQKDAAMSLCQSMNHSKRIFTQECQQG